MLTICFGFYFLIGLNCVIIISLFTKMSSLTYRKSYRVNDTDFDCHQYCMSLPDLRFNGKRKRKGFSFNFRNFLSSSRPQLSTSGHIYRQIEWKVFVFTIILPNGSKQKVNLLFNCFVNCLIVSVTMVTQILNTHVHWNNYWYKSLPLNNQYAINFEKLIMLIVY